MLGLIQRGERQQVSFCSVLYIANYFTACESHCDLSGSKEKNVSWEEPLPGRSPAWEEPAVIQFFGECGLQQFLSDDVQRVRILTVSLSQRRGHTYFPLEPWRGIGGLVGRNNLEKAPL